MSITIPSKYIGEVKNKMVPQCEIKWTLEDGNERYIKFNMGIKE